MDEYDRKLRIRKSMLLKNDIWRLRTAQKLLETMNEGYLSSKRIEKEIEIIQIKISICKDEINDDRFFYVNEIKELNVALKENKITKAEYDRRCKHANKRISEYNKVLKYLNEIEQCGMVGELSSKEYLDNLFKATKGISRVKYFLMEFRNFPKPNLSKNSEEENDILILQNAFSKCMDPFYQEIRRFEKNRKNYIDTKIRRAKRLKVAESELDDYEKLIGQLEVKFAFHNKSVRDENMTDHDRIITRRLEYSTSKQIFNFDTFPSEKEFKEVIEYYRQPKGRNETKEYIDESEVRTALKYLDFLNDLEHYLNDINFFPNNISVEPYSSLKFGNLDFTKFNQALEEFKEVVSKIKSKYENKLTVYNKYKKENERRKKINRRIEVLSHLYKKREETFGKERKKIDLEIENYKKKLIEEGFSEQEVFHINNKAESLGTSNASMSKFKSVPEKTRAERKAEYIANTKLDSETDRNIRMNAEGASKVRFGKNIPIDYVSGDYVPGHEITEFEQDYIEKEKEKVLAAEFEKKEREKEEAERAKLEAMKAKEEAEIKELLIQGGINEDMLWLSASILARNHTISSDNYDKLPGYEKKKVIKYVAKLKTLAGLTPEEKAREMAKDLYINPYTGERYERENPNQAEIMGQMTINTNHNVSYLIDEIFGHSQKL